MNDNYQAIVIQDPYEPSLHWLRVTHNGNSFSTIRILSADEALQIINVLQQSFAPDPPAALGNRTDSPNMFVRPESRTDDTAGR